MTIPSYQNPKCGDFCLLCGGVPEVAGYFIPDDPVAYGGKEGKKRIIQYCLCEQCRKKSGAQDRIEKAIKAALAGGCVHAE